MNQEQCGKSAPLVLASRSPRRIELLREAGFEFEVLSPEVDEVHEAGMEPGELTELNARRKAMAAAVQRPESVVVGADTLVYLNGRPLGKPETPEEAQAMLRQLSGRVHHVCTGVHVAWEGGRQGRGLHVLSKVRFKELSDEQIQAYHALVNPFDKAGAYGIQEHGEMIIEGHEGSWTNIMGLPMEVLTPLLRSHLDRGW
ncbi:MAG: Septum formation protein Maf [Prosthecobacter sp.]|nr:Septum formation protein Maf [Prosthecobacter sp.]